MIRSERLHKIVEFVECNGYVTYDKLTQEVKVTERTIRRDVDDLSKQGLLCKVWGGVKSIDAKVSLESEFSLKGEIHQEQKQSIGKAAAALIEDGECVGIDVGTTAVEITKHLRNKKELTVITASIPVILELMNNGDSNVICTGGRLSRSDKGLNGQYATTILDEYIMDKVFLGVAGMSFEFGFSLFNVEDAIVKKKMISRAREVIIVMDASKVGHTKHAILCGFDKVHKIITDKSIDPSVVEQLESYGIEVIII
ncbi:DeoR/GlpR family DNA-binding transcription regulator [[Clostridium] innocuum]|nr:DeoR/GlpR family DNA-binding transcription regulator [[Clostridium] innocuum]